MKLITTPLTITELKKMAEKRFGDLVKAVVDIDKKILMIDADLHADEEKYLLENGSNQMSLWGINLYPEKFNTVTFIEFDSMINLRPSQNNRSRGVEDAKIRTQIVAIVNKLIKS